MTKKSRRSICFVIDDFEEKDRIDPGLVPKLEITFPPLGALTMKVDVSLNLYCLLIEAPDLQVEDLIAVFTRMGLNAHVKGD
jgi:hypothetical protein